MQSGALIHLPMAGGVLDQDDFLLDLMYLARRVWYVSEYKSVNRMEISEGDREFMDWVVSGYKETG